MHGTLLITDRDLPRKRPRESPGQPQSFGPASGLPGGARSVVTVGVEVAHSCQEYAAASGLEDGGNSR